MADDPFEDLLNLEDQFYREGYTQGTDDGIKAGRIEGRSFGLEKGFEKFVESGRLYGKAIVWANRSPRSGKEQVTTSESQQSRSIETPQNASSQASQNQLPALSANPRLVKHITALYALAESESLSTENTDEAVNDFDDRLKRAHGKAKIIEKMLGEESTKDGAQPSHGAGKPATGSANEL